MLGIDSSENNPCEFKVCIGCKQLKPITDYHLDRSERIIENKKYPPVRRNACKTCRRKGGKKMSTEGNVLMKRYGMTRPPIGTPCDLCKKTNCKLVFDHCHDTKKFRGWLCDSCNTSIGKLGDNVEGLQNAINYLNREIKFDNGLF